MHIFFPFSLSLSVSVLFTCIECCQSVLHSPHSPTQGHSAAVALKPVSLWDASLFAANEVNSLAWPKAANLYSWPVLSIRLEHNTGVSVPVAHKACMVSLSGAGDAAPRRAVTSGTAHSMVPGGVPRVRISLVWNLLSQGAMDLPLPRRNISIHKKATL